MPVAGGLLHQNAQQTIKRLRSVFSCFMCWNHVYSDQYRAEVSSCSDFGREITAHRCSTDCACYTHYGVPCTALTMVTPKTMSSVQCGVRPGL